MVWTSPNESGNFNEAWVRDNSRGVWSRRGRCCLDQVGQFQIGVEAIQAPYNKISVDAGTRDPVVVSTVQPQPRI